MLQCCLADLCSVRAPFFSLRRLACLLSTSTGAPGSNLGVADGGEAGQGCGARVEAGAWPTTDLFLAGPLQALVASRLQSLQHIAHRSLDHRAANMSWQSYVGESSRDSASAPVICGSDTAARACRFQHGMALAALVASLCVAFFFLALRPMRRGWIEARVVVVQPRLLTACT